MRAASSASTVARLRRSATAVQPGHTGPHRHGARTPRPARTARMCTGNSTSGPAGKLIRRFAAMVVALAGLCGACLFAAVLCALLPHVLALLEPRRR